MDRTTPREPKFLNVKTMTLRELLKNLIEILLANPSEETMDKKKKEMIRGYLICFKSYSKSKTLFRYIREYLNTENKLIPIYRIIYLWVLFYFYEDFWQIPHSKERQRLAELINYLQKSPRNRTEIQFEVNKVKLLLLRKHKQLVKPKLNELKNLMTPKLKDPISPKTKRPSLFSFGIVQVAEQLTLLETELFRQIELAEFIEPTHARARRLKAFVERSNKLTFAVASYILAQPEPAQQARVIKFFLSVAQICEKLGNFNSVFGIMNCFHLHFITRLHKLWKLDAPTLFILGRFRNLTKPEKNNSIYRNYLAENFKEKFVLPYFGLLLKDLTLIREGNNSLIGSKINLERLDLMTTILAQISDYQTRECPVKSEKIPRLIQLLTCLCHWPEEKLSQTSYTLVPSKNISETESSGSDALDNFSVSEGSTIGSLEEDGPISNASGLVDLSSYDEESFNREIALFS